VGHLDDEAAAILGDAAVRAAERWQEADHGIWEMRGEPATSSTLMTSYANDVGLLAEEVDGRTGELLGNFPQAFIGLVDAAYAIAEAERRRG
jgi:GH15 family glucan-1,4-alpha-glucosidase